MPFPQADAPALSPRLAVGLLFGLGLLTPLAAGAPAATMVVAIRTDHAGKGPWYFNGGWEYNVVLGSVALSFALGGPGQASIDAALGWHLFGTVWGLATIGVTAVSAMLTLAVRRARPAGIGLERVAWGLGPRLRGADRSSS